MFIIGYAGHHFWLIMKIACPLLCCTVNLEKNTINIIGCTFLQGDQKKQHANRLFVGEIKQSGLPKFAFNPIRGWQIWIWIPILAISIPSAPKSLSNFEKMKKIASSVFFFFFQMSRLKVNWCMKNVIKQSQCMDECLFKQD